VPPFGAAVFEHGGDRLRRHQFDESAPGGPVSLAGTIDCAVEHVAR
jgi:hypothetical protein